MNKIAPIRFKFVYEETADSERRVRVAYARIFELARQEMLLDSQSTQEYIRCNGNKDRVFDARGSSGDIKGQEDNNLSDVPGWKDTGSEVWKSMADKQ